MWINNLVFNSFYMRILKNTLLTLLISTLLLANVFAWNKEDLLAELDILKTSLEDLSDTKESDLKTKVFALSDDYNNLFEDLGYDEDTINYLVSLWELDEDFKWDLVVEYTTLKNDIISKITNELLKLNNLADEIDLNYTTVSDTQRVSLEIEINQIESNLEDYTELFTKKISDLENKYESDLETVRNNIKTIVSSSSSYLDFLSSFELNFDNYSDLVKSFNTNYLEFKESYLSYAWEITSFSETKRNEYEELLKTNLTKLIEKNIELNPSLEAFESDLERFMDILMENFEYKLDSEIWKEYDVLYTQADINSLLNQYEDMENRYYDAEGKIKAWEVISSTWVLDTLENATTKLSEVNEKVEALLGDGNNTLEVIKIKLENEIIKFYNDNYTAYKDDLANKIKEKLRIISLENKNAISIAETIDIRYELLSDELNWNYNIEDINERIETFKNQVNKFTALNNEALNIKIENLNYNLDTFALKREIKHAEYIKLSS